MQPTHPNDYLWQEIASYQQYAHTQFDAAVQALTLYLQVWLVLAAAFSVLALGLMLFRAWRRRWAQKHEKITATQPAQANHAVVEENTSHPDLALPSLQVRY